MAYPLFTELALAYGPHAFAIVFSGAGNQARLGLADINSAGGCVLLQRQEVGRAIPSADHTALEELADEVLTVRQLAARLKQYVAALAPVASTDVEALPRILQHLRHVTGHDFTAYKKSTLQRRIERRIAARGAQTWTEYATLLHSDRTEVDTLFREMLIRVTTFFRDRSVFDSLRQELRRVFNERSEEEPFRVWVPACATGEEAYSLAMLIRELQSELDLSLTVQIFATDLDPSAIERARAGCFSASAVTQMTSEQADRFLVRERSGYRVSKEIRDLIVFAQQNVTQDPPFTKLDLLSCRNLLIYLEPELQRHVLALFSFALRPDGLLLLGTSETAAGAAHSFQSVHEKVKLYRRRSSQSRTPAPFPRSLSVLGPASQRRSSPLNPPPTSSMTFAERALLASAVPPSVLVDDAGDIVHFHGRTGQFLEPPAGEPSSNLFAMARDGLRFALPAALRKAALQPEPVVVPGLLIKNGAALIAVRVTVRRVTEPAPAKGLFIVSFEQEPIMQDSPEQPGAPLEPEQRSRLGELELELQHTRDNLQGTIEQVENSNEELKSTNEELQSTNEELQSTNEELETSREEMQSLNEELQTVNSELEDRNRALSQVNNDMQNLLNSTDIATVFLDSKLAIRRFTTPARKVFSLLDADIGRPLSDLAPNLDYAGLQADAQEVLRTLVYCERELRTREGAWRLMRIMPYRTAENLIDGLVMTFIDIDQVRRREADAEEARRLADLIVEAIPNGVVVLDGELKVVSANPAFLQMFHLDSRLAVGLPLKALTQGTLAVTELTTALEALSHDPTSLQLELPNTAGPFGTRVHVSARRVAVSADSSHLVLLFSQVAAS